MEIENVVEGNKVVHKPKKSKAPRCSSCGELFIAEDPDDDVCQGCKIDEAEYNYGNR